MQPVAVLGSRELVVGAAGGDPAAEARDRIGVQRPADGARRVDVAFGRERRVGRDHCRADLARHPSGELRVEVGDEHPRAVLGEPPGQTGADRADTLHEHRAPAEIRRPEDVLGARADPVEHPAGGSAAAVAAAAGRPEHPGAPLGDDVEVGRRDVHVARGLVGAAERLDEIAVAEEQPPPRVALRQLRHGQHRLPAAARHIRNRHLPAHRRGEPHRVREPVRRLRVDAHPRPAAGRPEHRRVDAHEHPRAAGPVEPDDRLLAVPLPQQILEHTQDNTQPPASATIPRRWPESGQS